MTLERGEKLEPVANLAERLMGKRPVPGTVVRWCKRGVGGVVLPSRLACGRRCSTERVFEEWAAASSEASSERRSDAAAGTV